MLNFHKIFLSPSGSGLVTVYNQNKIINDYLNNAVSQSERIDILCSAITYYNWTQDEQKPKAEKKLAKKLERIIGSLEFYSTIPSNVNHSHMKEVVVSMPDIIILADVPERCAVYFNDKVGKLAGMLFRFEEPSGNYWTVILDSMTLLSPSKYSSRQEAVEAAIKLGFVPFVSY